MALKITSRSCTRLSRHTKKGEGGEGDNARADRGGGGGGGGKHKRMQTDIKILLKN